MSHIEGSTPLTMALAVMLALLAVPHVWAAGGVSSGDERSLIVRAGCPTFTWAPTLEAATELRVWRLDADGKPTADAALLKRFPEGASSWTAPREECLAPGRYAWTVRGGNGAWAPRWVFDVPAPLAGTTEMDNAAARIPRLLSAFTPPPCVAGQEIFADVPASDPFCAWIQQLYSDNVTGGCAANPLRYCPGDAVTRGQMAIFLERAMRGTATWDPSSHAHFGQLWQGSASIALEVSNATGTGVLGRSASTSPGVLGRSEGIGVYGVGTDKGVYGSGNYGLYGDGGNYGIYGTGASYGVYGNSANVGVFAQGGSHGLSAFSSAGNGVLGASSTGVGVRASTSSGTAGTFVNSNAGTAVYLADSSRAAWFTGNAHVAGTLTKAAGSFRIDHPLDPENKYLSHSFVESSDMMNVYNGNAVLDARGEAVVDLPEWFEALNRDFRYQLSALGVSQPGLHVAEKVKGNRFRIGGGVPGAEVSWQVTGIRDDAYARAHRIPVEEEKAEDERGFYLFPEGFGASQGRSLSSARRPRGALPAAQ